MKKRHTVTSNGCEEVIFYSIYELLERRKLISFQRWKKSVCANLGKFKTGRKRYCGGRWLAGGKVGGDVPGTAPSSRRQFTKGEGSEDGLLGWSGVATGTFSGTRGCSGLSSGVFASCMSRDAWDWGHCSGIVQLWPCWPLSQGPIKPLA